MVLDGLDGALPSAVVGASLADGLSCCPGERSGGSEVFRSRLPAEVARAHFDRALAVRGATAAALRGRPELLKALNEDLAGREPVGMFARHAVAVVLRVAELGGAHLDTVDGVRWRDAEASQRSLLVGVEPLDAAFPSRVRTLALPLPHLLNLVLDGVFVGPDRPEPLSDRDRAEVFVMAWRAALAVERAWDGPPSVPFETQEWEP